MMRLRTFALTIAVLVPATIDAEHTWETHQHMSCHAGQAPIAGIPSVPGGDADCERWCQNTTGCVMWQLGRIKDPVKSLYPCWGYLRKAAPGPNEQFDCGCVDGCPTTPSPAPPLPPSPPAPPASAFAFAHVVTNDMVLAAAPKQSMIWGYADPGAHVTVGFNGKNLTTTIGPDQTGQNTTWRLLLPPTPAGFTTHNITATDSTTGITIVVTGVLFGEVWLCSGQSNMAYPLAMDGNGTCWDRENVDCHDASARQCTFGCVENARQEIDAMAGYDDSMRLLRVAGAGPWQDKTVPLADNAFQHPWLKPSASKGLFSAMCWFFGRDLFAALGKTTPIGLIETDVSGTPDQHWSSPDALDACKGSDPWDWPSNFTDSVLWNGQVVPLLRTVHSGVIWMQGEANAGVDGRQYKCSFPAMITDWRAKWHQNTDGATAADFPFGWSQLNAVGKPEPYEVKRFDPTCGGTGCQGDLDEWRQSFQALRLAQDATRSSLTNVFQAVILDTPVASGSIHSCYKQPAGARLARRALALVYGRDDLRAIDPVATGVTIDGSSLTVTIAGVGAAGLDIKTGAAGFEVLGNCSSASTLGPLCWTPCNITSARSASVTIGSIPSAPVAVRYLYQPSPCGTNTPYQCPVYAKATALGSLSGENHNLPLGPFVIKL